jgi:hypothetical protein
MVAITLLVVATIFAFFGVGSPERSIFRLLFALKSIVMNPSLINSNESTKKLSDCVYKEANILLTCPFRLCFWSSVSKRGTHLAQMLLHG